MISFSLFYPFAPLILEVPSHVRFYHLVFENMMGQPFTMVMVKLLLSSFNLSLFLDYVLLPCSFVHGFEFDINIPILQTANTLVCNNSGAVSAKPYGNQYAFENIYKNDNTRLCYTKFSLAPYSSLCWFVKP